MPPEAGKWDTNLMVTTNLRMYDIDLHLLPGNNSGKAPLNRVAYRVEYKYPADELAAAASVSAARGNEAMAGMRDLTSSL